MTKPGYLSSIYSRAGFIGMLLLWWSLAALAFEPADICPKIIQVPGMMGPVTVDAYSGEFSNEAEWVFCVPAKGWNGDLVVLSHGTVNALREGGKIEEIKGQMEFGTVSIPEMINGLGYAFAVSARSKSGLSVIEGVEEASELYDVFEEQVGQPDHAFLVGVSQGAAIATLLVEFEQGDPRFQGALAACGPIGHFRKQLSYFLNFLVLFEYYFRPELTQAGITLLEKDMGNPHVPDSLLDQWEGKEHQEGIKDEIQTIIFSAPADKLGELLKVARVPGAYGDDTYKKKLVADLVNHIVPGVNDVIETLGGNPFDNRFKFYWGATEPFILNHGVLRFSADRDALVELKHRYETSGNLTSQLVSLHTIGDHRVPFWHEIFYFFKTLQPGLATNYSLIPIDRPGHCAFEPVEALAAFALLIGKSTGFDFQNAEWLLKTEVEKQRFRQILEQF